jgi:hypothetical protein
MKINHFVCPNCNFDFYSTRRRVMCDSCGKKFFPDESDQRKASGWITNLHLKGYPPSRCAHGNFLSNLFAKLFRDATCS